MRLTVSIFIGLGLSLLLPACGGGGGVTAQLLRLDTARSSHAAVGSRSGVDINSNITIESLKVPIRSVGLNSDASGSNGTTVYTCDADTNDGCLVDLAAAGALENLLTSATSTSIDAKTYSYVQISTCKDEGTYTGKIKASGKVDPGGSGSTLYTQSTSGALTSDVNAWGEASVYFTGCSRLYPLPTPITVTAGSTITVKLYFDIRDIAFFGDAANAAGSQAWYAGGSSYVYPANPPGTYVGVNYLDVAGTVDTGEPTIERFRVTVDNAGDAELGTIGLMYTSAGEYFGGFSRSYFSAASEQGQNRFVTPLQTFTDNGDSTYTIANYGSSNTGVGYFNATTFVKATSATPRTFTDKDGASLTYTIEALP